MLLVSPPSPDVLARHQEVATFAEVQQEVVATAASSIRLVCSDDDPYCPEGARAAYTALDLDTDVIPGGRHLDPDAGYGARPSAAAWYRNPDTRLTAR